MRIVRALLIAWVLVSPLAVTGGAARPGAQDAPVASAAVLPAFPYRALGPYRAGSWVSDIAVPDGPASTHLYTFYVALRYGGLWKTTNNGTTFEPVFDGQDVTGIGCVTVAPSDSNTIWVGSGDASSVRVAYPGNGVYRSSDAGKTWQHLGLAATQHIARIVVHPTRPSIVYVAAMGRLWSPNEDRGVFKTTDGGRTWKKVLYIDDKTGVIDLVMNRKDPDTLYAATYEVQRRPWRLLEGGPGSGIHQTTDGGRTWKKLGGGLPAGPLGRTGLDVYQKNPNIVYAVTENLSTRPPTADEARRDRARGGEPRPRTVGGEVYRSDDAGRTWRKMNAATDDVSSKAGYSFNQIRVDPNDDRRIIVNSDALLSSEDGGRTWQGLTWDSRSLFGKAFGDWRAMWIDPQNSKRMILGSDGGVSISYDGGKTADSYANLPGGEVYAIDVDLDDPYNIYAGLQDHDSWKGPVNGRHGRLGPEDWVTVGDNDGMYNRVDPADSRWLYNTVQWGGHHRVDQLTHTRTSIVPVRPAGQPPLRFNWTPPILVSPHNGGIIYTGAQVLFRSLDRGAHWEEISPDLTTNDASKISPPGSSVQFCTVTTISESPLAAGTIWVGTDDGQVHVTRDHGATWTTLTDNVAAAGGPYTFWVTRVTASRFAPGTAYVAKSGRRFDDMRPVILRTTDFGATWALLSATLPERAVDVVVEDVEDKDILFAGTSDGVFASLDGGRQWRAMAGNMPPVPVTDLVVHPRERDLVVATYGRGLYVANIAWLDEVKRGALDEPAHFFAVRPRRVPPEGPWGNFEFYGDRQLIVPNDEGLDFDFHLAQKPAAKVTLRVADASGSVIHSIETEAHAGLNRVSWDMRSKRGQPVVPGDYVVTLEIDATRLTQKATVLPAPPPGGRR